MTLTGRTTDTTAGASGATGRHEPPTAQPPPEPPPEENSLTPARVRAAVPVPVRCGSRVHTATLTTFHELVDGREHLALLLGSTAASVPLVRLHSECLTGDVFASERCDCGAQLDEALARIAVTGGVLLYLRQEGRGIGLYNKLDAYRLQDRGLDTYAANRALGLEDDARDYTAAAQMLTALGHQEIDLLTNNPDKRRQLEQQGISVRSVVPTGVHLTAHNTAYLRAKATITAHTLLMEGPQT
ncbi:MULTISPECIES: GTP cyclohydrolase II [unclassified Streptomyces]|uniref:GTP cyclohydrolase II n=1 Tax=unclassified Streptomyces TaxID=2593676 RepID=UPI002E1372D3|nr:GTP cyclohydrolase II [Streptomyces sp. NBC_01197]WSS53046.1 GTP cyclohydrolase II [Streptomyces sp. NBC_01180]